MKKDNFLIIMSEEGCFIVIIEIIILIIAVSMGWLHT
jgi:hypothetical protein